MAPADARGQGPKLADIILGKIKEKETEIASQASEAAANGPRMSALDPKVSHCHSNMVQLARSTKTSLTPDSMTAASDCVRVFKYWEDPFEVQGRETSEGV